MYTLKHGHITYSNMFLLFQQNLSHGTTVQLLSCPTTVTVKYERVTTLTTNKQLSYNVSS